MTTPDHPATPARPADRAQGPRPRRPRPAGRHRLRRRAARARSLLSLFFWKTAFMFIVAAPSWSRSGSCTRGLLAKGIDIPEQPLMLGGVVMVVVAYFWGAPALVTATAVTALVTMLWLLRRGVDGYVQNATASVFTLIYVPFLGSFVALLLAEGGRAAASASTTTGVRGIITFIAVTIASDIGGYVAGVLFGKHPMAPVISPEEVVGGLRRLGGLLRRGRLGLVVVPPRRRLVGRRRSSA